MMRIVVIADEITQKEFQEKAIGADVQVNFFKEMKNLAVPVDACFYLKAEEALTIDILQLETLDAPVFVNAVITRLKDLPSNCTRINAWPGFLLNKKIELAARSPQLDRISKILEGLHWEFENVADIIGMITPRIISMIVNEAYFALEEQISSKEEIDIAMKYGTNYPFGPFEWSEKIGLTKIYNLLMQLSETDLRYTPAPLLQKAINL